MPGVCYNVPTPSRGRTHLLSDYGKGTGPFAGIYGAYPRAFYRAVGYTDSDFERPLIGIANSWSETCPGHAHLRTLAEWVKEGVRAAGGMPVEFNTVAPCDGIAQGHGMHYILPLRDIIAASVELMAGAHSFAGMVMLCSCDKIVPGMLMAAARLNLPTIFVPGGPMLPGRAAGRQIIASDVKEAMGRYKAGLISADDLYEIEVNACPGPGACSFMGTANTMACITEALGMCLPGAATLPAVDPARRQVCVDSGARLVELVRLGVRARRHSQPGKPGKRRARLRGRRWLDQRHAAPARPGAGAWRRHRPRHLRPAQPADAADRQISSGQPADCGRPAPGGRRSRRAEHPGAPAEHSSADRQRPERGRDCRLWSRHPAGGATPTE